MGSSFQAGRFAAVNPPAECGRYFSEFRVRENAQGLWQSGPGAEISVGSGRATESARRWKAQAFGVAVEAGLMAMLDRMRTGQLKVFKEHLDWWEEFRLYHRKDGKVVKEGDDLLCATRYALMFLRYASTQSFADK